jgi:hypothetical protein
LVTLLYFIKSNYILFNDHQNHTFEQFIVYFFSKKIDKIDFIKIVQQNLSCTIQISLTILSLWYLYISNFLEFITELHEI